jgi:hypothetical protein
MITLTPLTEHWEIALFAIVLMALLVSRWQLARLRRRERDLVAAEARLEARQQVSDERAALEEGRLRQRFEEGLREGIRQVAAEEKGHQSDVYKDGYERGLLEGERNAENHFRLEYWTEIQKNQGYFFTSAEVIACYQLMYKQIPIGPPQRHTLEKSESIDRGSMDEMLGRILGDQPGDARLGNRLGNIQLVNREATPPKKSLLSRRA